jgi:hypothetical protein
MARTVYFGHDLVGSLASMRKLVIQTSLALVSLSANGSAADRIFPYAVFLSPPHRLDKIALRIKRKVLDGESAGAFAVVRSRIGAWICAKFLRPIFADCATRKEFRRKI